MSSQEREDIRVTFLRLCLTAATIFAIHGLKEFANEVWFDFAFDCIEGDQNVINTVTADLTLDVTKRYKHVIENDRLVLNEAYWVTLAHTGIDQQLQTDHAPAWDALLVEALTKVSELLPRVASPELVERFKELRIKRDDHEEAVDLQKQLQKLVVEINAARIRE